MDDDKPAFFGPDEFAIPREWGESAWHKNWKEAFPLSFREQTFFSRELGYYHRADIQTNCGTTIEFQHSPISVDELKSRETFYPKLIWIVNGTKFKGFKVLKSLPLMDDPALGDFEFCHKANLTMVRKSEILSGVANPKVMTFHHPQLRKIPLSSHLYSFRWLHPHKVWYQASCPIIIDLGGYFLYQLKHRSQLNGDYPYLEMIPRGKFIAQYL